MTDTLADFVPDWTQHLRAAGKSLRIVAIYEGAAVELIAFLESRGRPTEPNKVKRRDLERYLVYFAGRPNKNTGCDLKRSPDHECTLDCPGAKPVAPGYVNQQYRSLQQFFRWFHEVEEEISETPFARMTPPSVPEKLVPVLDEEALRALLDACRGSNFTERRDTAIIRMFVDTGVAGVRF